MSNLIKIAVNILYIVSFCGLILAGGLGIVYEIVGHARFERLLSRLGISNGFDRVLIVGSIMLVLLIAAYLLKTKVFSE